MQQDLLTGLIHKSMTLRLRAIERYGQHAEEIQSRQFARVLRVLNTTQYRRSKIDKPIKSYAQFRAAIPVVEYEDLRPFVELMLQGQKQVLTSTRCRWYAMSSGTSGGRSKYLPVPPLHLHDCHYRGGGDSLWLYLDSRPDSHFFKHKSLVIGGSHRPTPLNKGIHTGDLSAILIQHMPSLGRMFRVPSTETLLMDEWLSKMATIIEEVRTADVGSLSGVPSWMLEVIQALLNREGKETLTEVWPNLEVFFHGGISFDPYRARYKELIPSDRMQYRETYNASEGFFGIQNTPTDPAMLLMIDYGIFYEFIALEDLQENKFDKVIPLTEVETNKTYAMIISTLGGLYRYLIGDTVRFTSTHPYKIIIAGRTSNFINAFGEELMEHNANKALAQVAQQHGCHVKEYTVAPVFLLDQAKGYHHWLIEFDQTPQDIDRFAQDLDQALRADNSDYDAKRYADTVLQNLQITIAKPGLFSTWLESKGKLGGQNKVPRMRNNDTLMQELLAL